MEIEHYSLAAADLDGYLDAKDRKAIAEIEAEYLAGAGDAKCWTRESGAPRSRAEAALVARYQRIGEQMAALLANESRIHVYSLETAPSFHGEASRLVARLRDPRTQRPEFVYYTQRAYELLFNLAFAYRSQRRPLVVDTPVTVPWPAVAVHRIPDIDEIAGRGAMCVLLRAALLPSMILAKEIQEYHSQRISVPFALFKISRDDRRVQQDMVYNMDLRRSYLQPERLDGRDWLFADPMNATAGSLVTTVSYLKEQGLQPKAIRFFNVVASLKGALRVVRALPEAEVYTLWMDPALNDKAYILPGLGDAGDRLNGADPAGSPRGILQLIAGYGGEINSLYRDQIREIERVVLPVNG